MTAVRQPPGQQPSAKVLIAAFEEDQEAHHLAMKLERYWPRIKAALLAQQSVAEAVAAERERCARIADDLANEPARPEQFVNWAPGKRYGAQKVAAAIRSGREP